MQKVIEHAQATPLRHLKPNTKVIGNRLHRTDPRRCFVNEKKRVSVKLKETTVNAESISSKLNCYSCNRQARAKIGLVSHQRTHLATCTLMPSVQSKDGHSHICFISLRTKLFVICIWPRNSVVESSVWS